MEFKDLPTTEDFTAYDWREVLGCDGMERDGAPTATARYAGDVTSPGRTPLHLEAFTKVVALYAVTDGPGSVCHELDAVILIELVDGGWALCEAWTDCTGWGCQDGVEWWVGTQEQIRKLITAEQARKLNEVGWR